MAGMAERCGKTRKAEKAGMAERCGKTRKAEKAEMAEVWEDKEGWEAFPPLGWDG
jgi:hypothetical protein